MSGILRSPSIPSSEPSRTAEWLGFFTRLISRKPSYDEVHIVTAGIIYFGDSETDGSWRIMISGSDFVHQQRSAGSWVTVATGASQLTFCATLSGTQSNISASTEVTVQFDSELFDTGSDFNTGTYTFTAPADGYYQLNAVVRLDDLRTESNTYWYCLYIVTTKKTFTAVLDVESHVSLPNIKYHTFTLPVIAEMDEGDTAIVQVRQEGGSAQTDVNTASWFSGSLIKLK